MNTLLRFPGGRAKALTLSYDDGVQSDIRLIEIMNAHGLKGTFNLNGGIFAPEGTVYPAGTIHRRMSKSDALACFADDGMEVAIHGYTHPFLEQLPDSMLAYEILRDRAELENLFGRIIRGCAYPFGTFNDRVVDSLRNAGIVYARTTVATGKFDIPHDWLRLPATCHHNNARLMELAQNFIENKPSNSPWLLYLWGHSYEFDHDNNWGVMEDFASAIAGNDDIWHATNIEIYDYIAAYNALQFSTGGTIIHNPSALDVWFDCQRSEPIKVAAGEIKIL